MLISMAPTLITQEVANVRELAATRASPRMLLRLTLGHQQLMTKLTLGLQLQRLFHNLVFPVAHPKLMSLMAYHTLT